MPAERADILHWASESSHSRKRPRHHSAWVRIPALPSRVSPSLMWADVVVRAHRPQVQFFLRVRVTTPVQHQGDSDPGRSSWDQRWCHACLGRALCDLRVTLPHTVHCFLTRPCPQDLQRDVPRAVAEGLGQGNQAVRSWDSLRAASPMAGPRGTGSG